MIISLSSFLNSPILFQHVLLVNDNHMYKNCVIYTFRSSTSSKCTSLIEHQSNIPHTYSLIRSVVVRLGRLRRGFGRLQTFSSNKKRNCFLSRYVYLLFLRYKCHSIIALSASFVFLKREILQHPESIIPRFFVRPRNRFL